MNITRGKTNRAIKVVICGPEGIGKSTFASEAPDPIFVDIEGSTAHMDVARLDTPSSWPLMLKQLQWIRDTKPCKSVVIDSADWAEKLCNDYVIQKNGWDSIEAPGYGKGFTIAAEEFSRFLNLLSDIIEVGINVVVTAHSVIRKFEEPDQMGAYDRYELKLDKRNGPALKEWTDLLLFANYKTDIITDSKTKTKKATGGRRVMYTAHHPAYDAKNRMNLPEELDLDMGAIAHLFGDQPTEQSKAPVQEPKQDEPTTAILDFELPEANPLLQPDLANEPKPVRSIDKRLIDLLKVEGKDVDDLERALGPSNVGGLGFWPADMKAEDYPTDFVDFIVTDWANVQQALEATKLPFDI